MCKAAERLDAIELTAILPSIVWGVLNDRAKNWLVNLGPFIESVPIRVRIPDPTKNRGSAN